jgi:hypothetical protein
VAYGEEPFSAVRLDELRQLFDRLMAQGFHGRVELHSVNGRFCLVGNATEGYSLAPDEMLYSRCDTVGAVSDDAQRFARMPVALADLMGSFNAKMRGTAQAQLMSPPRGALDGAGVPYPAISATLQAGDWNRAAAVNNRVEVRVIRDDAGR